MNRDLLLPFGRFALVGALALASFTTACSDDDGDDKASQTTAAPGEESWCNANREAVNAPSGESVDAIKAAADLAPDDLKEDYEALIEFWEYEAENPTDLVGIQERQAEVAKPLTNLLDALDERCGITVNIFGA
jgi:hypothetical protein